MTHHREGVPGKVTAGEKLSLSFVKKMKRCEEAEDQRLLGRGSNAVGEEWL